MLFLMTQRIGPVLTQNRTSETGFQVTMERCNLIDLGFNGDPFTWARGATRKRLDRVVCNLDWRLRFNETVIYHLPKLKSDHSPLLSSYGL